MCVWVKAGPPFHPSSGEHSSSSWRGIPSGCSSQEFCGSDRDSGVCVRTLSVINTSHQNRLNGKTNSYWGSETNMCQAAAEWRGEGCLQQQTLV